MTHNCFFFSFLTSKRSKLSPFEMQRNDSHYVFKEYIAFGVAAMQLSNSKTFVKTTETFRFSKEKKNHIYGSPSSSHINFQDMHYLPT